MTENFIEGEDTPYGKEQIIPKGTHNPHGSVTGPYNTAGGWGKPASKGEHKCPKCESLNFHYEPGFAESAKNVCPDCGYDEWFCY